MNVRVSLFGALATVLGSTVFYPLFVSGHWFWSGLGAVVVVTGTGLVCRRLLVPAGVTVAAQLALLVVYLAARYAGGEAFGHVLPGPAALAELARLIGSGVTAAGRYTPPVPLFAGLSLLVTLGVGCAAALIDLLAARLHHAALAGLPLLAMFCIPVAISANDVPWPVFIASAAGFLLLILVDSRDRIAHWGRPVIGRRADADQPQDGTADARPLVATGRRIGFAAIAVAAILPLTVPGLRPNGLFGLGDGLSRHGSGGATVVAPDPLINLRDQLGHPSATAVLHYTSTDPAPDYLRTSVLDIDSLKSPSKATWRLVGIRGDHNRRIGDADLTQPPDSRTVQGRRVKTRVTVETGVRRMIFLPLPYPASRVDISGDWIEDPGTLMVFSPAGNAGGRSYQVVSRHLDPSRQRLENARGPVPDRVRRYLRRPDVPSSISKLASHITRNAHTPYDRAVALQDWFTAPGRFTYTLHGPQSTDIPALVDFLLVHRQGFCEQFATSMALLARLEGIPARVAIGYTAGDRDPKGGWTVTQADAHAWPELYFSGVGWLRFEPTPAAGGQGTATTPGYAVPYTPTGRGPGHSPAPGPTAGDGTANGATPGATAGPLRRKHIAENGTYTIPAAGTDGHGPLRWLAGAAVVLVALLLSPMLAGRLARRRRRRVPDTGDADERARRRAHAAWRTLRGDVLDLDGEWPQAMSPRATAHRVRTRLDPAARPASPAVVSAASAALARITDAEERARYARTPRSPRDDETDDGALAADCRAVRAGLSATAPRRTRVRAVLAPPSVMRGVGPAVQRALDVFAWLDLLSAAVQRRLPMPRRARRAAR